MCDYSADGVRFWHSDDHYTLVSGHRYNRALSKNAANHGRKGRKHPSEHRLAINGIRTATTEYEMNANEVRKGTHVDDEELSQTY
jgi:hypothetical protein